MQDICQVHLKKTRNKKNKSPHALAAKVYDGLLSAEKQAEVRYAQPKKTKKTFALIFGFLSLMALKKGYGFISSQDISEKTSLAAHCSCLVVSVGTPE